MVPGRGNRTFICSVVFLDIVEYSKKPVAEQIRFKEQLNALLAEALKDVAANDRIILDTGDGAAISFVGDPEDALFVCLTLRDAMKAPQTGDVPPLRLRIGINLGPVKLVRDLNDQPNIIGDGINVAQRVMGFALPDQILVSRSYYEVVSCLSDAYAKLFRYEGSRTDKHVREHEVYAVGDSTDEVRKKLEHEHSPTTQPLAGSAMARTVIDGLSQSAALVRKNLRARPRLGTALAVVGILVTAVVLRGLRGPEPAAPAPGPAATAKAPPVAPSKERPAPAPVVASPPEKIATAPAPAKRAAEPRPAVTGGPGMIVFTIIPWGEIYVDGRKQGVSPPLREVEVKPGRHKVEVRNADFPAHVETVEVQPGARIRIRHRFR